MAQSVCVKGSCGEDGGVEVRNAHRGGRLGRTVNGDGDGLGEVVAISTDEGGNLADRVGSKELGSRVEGVDDLDFEVDAVGLRDREDRGGAGVAL